MPECGFVRKCHEAGANSAHKGVEEGGDPSPLQVAEVDGTVEELLSARTGTLCLVAIFDCLVNNLWPYNIVVSTNYA